MLKRQWANLLFAPKPNGSPLFQKSIIVRNKPFNYVGLALVVADGEDPMFHSNFYGFDGLCRICGKINAPDIHKEEHQYVGANSMLCASCTRLDQITGKAIGIVNITKCKKFGRPDQMAACEKWTKKGQHAFVVSDPRRIEPIEVEARRTWGIVTHSTEKRIVYLS